MKRTGYLTIALLLTPLLAHAEQERLVVPTFSTSGVEANVAPVVTELALEALLNRHGVKALGPNDIKDLLNQQQQAQLVGCDQSSCMAQLAGAMGATRLVSGMLGRLGALYVVTLKLIDTETAKVEARASRRFAKIEEVPDAVGPLVDDLLKAKPRTRIATPSVLVERKRDVKIPKAMSAKAFCAEVANYSKMVIKRKYGRETFATRRNLLQDALRSAFVKEFDHKLKCVERTANDAQRGLVQARLLASTTAVAADVRRRALEWRTFQEQLELVQEAYRLGLEKEKNGTGARPTELGFEISTAVPDPLPSGKEIKAFARAYQRGQRVVKKALVAAKKGDKKTFLGLFHDAKAGKNRNRARRKWIDMVRDLEKMKIDTCPYFTLTPSELKSGADSLARRNKVRGCVRLVKNENGRAHTSRVYLERSGKAWRISGW